MRPGRRARARQLRRVLGSPERAADLRVRQNHPQSDDQGEARRGQGSHNRRRHRQLHERRGHVQGHRQGAPAVPAETGRARY